LRRFKDYLFLYIKGIGMGAADVIPGVSGGTIAFITGIYEELINSIRKVDVDALKLLKQFKIGEFWSKINGSFLIAVLGGIVTSLLSLAKLMNYLLVTFPIPVWSFFFGLILISAPLILREVKVWSVSAVIAGIAGVGFAYWITIVSPAQTPSNLFFIFLCGALAICAMILPGISGAFILLLLGKYEFMIKSLVEMNFAVVAVFVIGCAIGLLTFSRFLSWILTHYRYPTLALLSGFMLGSLNKVWPWKEVISFRLNTEGKQVPAIDQSIWPGQYLEKTGNDPQVFHAILFVALGILIVVFVEKLALAFKTKP
jgi:putative membrane protein